MTWRTIFIKSKAKLSYKNDYLVVRNEEIHMIHLSEINTVIIDSTAVTVTSYLISEMLSRKIKLIFCDDKRNPQGEVVPYYGCHDSSKKVHEQLKWDEYVLVVWTRIIKEKIINQSKLLHYYENGNYKKLELYASQLLANDITNREGHAAKVYFNSLFGLGFNREDVSDINASLNYGYAIILSQFNKEIVASGYLTQLGIKHSNYFNFFNLSSDLMEPFRPLIDKIVKDNYGNVFDITMKLNLIDVLNKKVRIKNREQYVSNAIGIYVKSVINAIQKRNIELLDFFDYEL